MNTTIQTNSRFNPAAIASRPPPSTRVAPPPVAEPTQVPPKAGGLKKLNFGNMAAKKDDSAKKIYPVFSDADGRAAALAATIAEQQERLDALDGSLET